MMKIAIIGGGVNGFGCAVKIKEAFPSFEVTVVTKDVTPLTTGDGSAGLWGPYILGDTPPQKIIDWSGETHNFFYELWRQGLAGSVLIPCTEIVSSSNLKVPLWKDIVYGFHEITKDELQRWNKTFAKEYKSGIHYITFTCEPTILLPYLMGRFSKAGGKIIMQEVKSLATFVESGYDVIVNCTGLASRYIVPDEKVFPTRGQVARVNTPWMYNCYFSDGNYIIPNTFSVVLGGTGQANDYNTNVSPNDSKFIFEGCAKIVPGLEKAETFFEWVGLRPSRKDSVRLERSDIKTKDQKNIVVIHNYGHGGSGVTLFWGCASEVLEILKNAPSEKTQRSKL